MKKNTWILTTVILVIVIGVGSYFIWHKSSPTPNASSSQSSSSSSANNTPASSDIIQTETASNVGQYLADSSGNALYTYNADSKGVSNCTGSCLTSWPVYGPSSSSSSTLPTNVTIITRSDGTKQYAYKELPLYTFTGDSAGQVTGNGVSGFSVAKP